MYVFKINCQGCVCKVNRTTSFLTHANYKFLVIMITSIIKSAAIIPEIRITNIYNKPVFNQSKSNINMLNLKKEPENFNGH